MRPPQVFPGFDLSWTQAEHERAETSWPLRPLILLELGFSQLKPASGNARQARPSWNYWALLLGHTVSANNLRWRKGRSQLQSAQAELNTPAKAWPGVASLPCVQQRAPLPAPGGAVS